MMTLAMNIETVSLDRIKRLSPLNPRQDAESDISMLIATIRAVGQKYPILLRPIPADPDGGYEVIEGGRRWRAQRALQAERPDEPIFVPAIISESDDDDARALGLAIAVTARPLHPVDEYEAFAALAAAGCAVERIAADFGLTTKQARQRLALGGLAPRLREMWRAGEIGAEAAREWARAPLAAQEALLAKWESDDALERCDEEYHVRRELTLGRVNAYSPLARFILSDKSRCEAYVAAGGRIEESLFADEIELLDGPIVERVVDDLLRAEARRVADAEGWGAALAETDVDDAIQAADYDLSDDEEAEIDRLFAQKKALINPGAASDATNELAGEIAAVDAKIRAVETAALLRAFPPDARGDYAVVACLADAGTIDVVRAVPRDDVEHEDAGDTDAATPAEDEYGDESDDGETAPAAEDAPPHDPPPHDPNAEPSKALRRVIDETATEALRAAARTRPDIGLMLAVAAMGGRYDVAGVALRPLHADADAAHPLLRQISPLRFDRALAACAQAPLADLTAAFAELLAAALSTESVALGTVHAICAAMRWRGAPLARLFSEHLDRDAFFAAAPKAVTKAIVAGLIGENEAARTARMKAPERARHAARISKDKDHLPAPFADWAGGPESETALDDAIDLAAPSLADAMWNALARNALAKDARPKRRGKRSAKNDTAITTPEESDVTAGAEQDK